MGQIWCKMCEVSQCGVVYTTCHKMASWLLDFPVVSSYYKSYVLGLLPAFRTPPPLLAAGALWVLSGRPQFGPSAGKKFVARYLQIAQKKTSAEMPWPWETRRDPSSNSHSWWWARLCTTCVRCQICGVVWAICHNMASWRLDFPIASSDKD